MTESDRQTQNNWPYENSLILVLEVYFHDSACSRALCQEREKAKTTNTEVNYL